MYIAPNSTIKLMATVPLDPSYDNTIRFETIEDQQAYFNTKTIHTLSSQYYQRAERGYCRVKLPIKNCLTVNYMAFKNTDFTAAYYDKWFYAFVLDVEYINNEVTEIQYQIDVMQTYWFDVEVLDSFVEREHIPLGNDIVGANIEPEPVQVSEFVANGSRENVPGADSYCLYVLVNNAEIRTRNTYGGIYSGLLLYAYYPDDTSGIATLINKFIAAPDSIVSMYMAPSYLVQSSIGYGGDESTHLVPSSQLFTPRDVWGSTLQMNATLDGYLPKNKKLYTYPYNFYNVFNADGMSMSLRYEFFDELRPKFKLYETFIQPVETSLKPINYKNVANPVLTESISNTGYPQCAWSVDAFKYWVAREFKPALIKAGANLLTLLAPMAGGFSGMTQLGDTGKIERAETSYNTLTGQVVATKNIGPARQSYKYDLGVSEINNVADALTQAYIASIEADITKGTISGSTMSVANKIKGFYAYRMSIVGSCAKRIDDFFTRYGYSVNQMKMPNFTGRTYFNYVKLSQANVHELPVRYCQQSDLELFKRILMRGITFWHDPTKCGQFTPSIMEAN